MLNYILTIIFIIFGVFGMVNVDTEPCSLTPYSLKVELNKGKYIFNYIQ